MLNVNGYLFILSGDSLANCVEVRSNEAPLHEKISTKELTKLVEDLREEVFSEIAFAAISDSDLLLSAGDRVEKLQKRYSDMLPHCLEYAGCWAVEKDELEIFLGRAFTYESFITVCGKAFLSGWAPHGTAWTAAFEVHNPETEEVSYRHSDIQWKSEN